MKRTLAALALAVALSATPASAAPANACKLVFSAPATVTNISRRPDGRYEVTVRLIGRRTVASVVTTRILFLRQTVRISGQLCGEGRIEGATIR